MKDILNLLTIQKIKGFGQSRIKSFYLQGMSDEQIIHCTNFPNFTLLRQETMRELTVLEGYGIKAISYLDEPLRDIPDAPMVLFCKGDISLLGRDVFKVAVIGTRDITPEIEDKERRIVREISRHAVTVSGLALGCDAIAHEETIRSGGRTIAILPSSIQTIKPATNHRLAQEILGTGGLLVSEYMFNATDTFEIKHRYIERDKLQPLFSNGVVLCTSKAGGGSRIAIGHASTMNRPVCALTFPALATDQRYELNRKLIESRSACAADSCEDISKWLETVRGTRPATQLSIF